MHQLPETGYLRLTQIIGQREVSEESAAANCEAVRQNRLANKKSAIKPTRPRKSVIGLLPISKSAWWLGVKEGRFPKPIKLGPRTTVWRVEDIRALIAKTGGVA